MPRRRRNRKGQFVRQTGKSNRARDRRVRAKKPGRRRSRSGRIYYERRRNRSDRGRWL